ncbi:ABC transporter ATP-binding protein/permease [Nocardioides sp. cx-169]|uniref:ABC transporter ATP-binding protein n=1 Tax=Nocardioides sp. cx-169 TaxID=2899080 RepID=UPI001E4B441E|nr:ABC transporter ATP-binding protein [Nocardioides sp. cx-169]MCD4532823.1 ABC transporter ATP-binding protein/permease [Nocardioides sp. cx-169]
MTAQPQLLPVSTSREAAALAWHLLSAHRPALATACAMFVVDALAGLVAPLMLGRIVDLVDRGADTGALVAPILWILGAALAAGAATALAIGALARAAEPALAELREQSLERALHLESAELEHVGSGDLLSRVSDDVRLVAVSITEVVPHLVSSLLMVVFTAIGLFTLDWRLGLAGLAAVPLYAQALRWYLPRSGPFYRREREANGERAEAFVTGVQGSRTLRAFGLAEQQQVRVTDASWRSADISIEVYRLYSRFTGRFNRAELVGLLVLLVVGFQLVRSDATTVGAVTAAALFFHRLFNPIGALLALFDEAQSAGASLTRIAGLAQLPGRDPAAAGPVLDRGDLAVTDLYHEYVAGRAAVSGVSLTVAQGERVAVVGATGAGKTTLGAAVAGQLRPTRGTVEVGGAPLRRSADGEREAVALVTQELHVFAMSVRDNLTLAAPSADDEQVRAALRLVGAWAWVAALPDGLDTVVGSGALPLTPAQTQQLALARVALADPLVVVLDEATAEAGSSGARALEEAAAAVTAGRTTVTIAHRLTQARAADRVVVMAHGRVVETGTHDELVAAGGVYAGLWHAWSGS